MAYTIYLLIKISISHKDAQTIECVSNKSVRHNLSQNYTASRKTVAVTTIITVVVAIAALIANTS